MQAGTDPHRPLGPCRLCGDPSWLADQRGPVHRCCAMAEDRGDTDCGACRTSRTAAARQQRTAQTRRPAAGDRPTGGRA